MDRPSDHRPAIVLAVLVAAAAATVIATIAHYPRMLDDPHAGVWIGLLVAVFAGYAAAPAFLRKTDDSNARNGLGIGVAAGLLWLGEIWTQAPARLPAALERTVPAICVLLAVLTTLAAGATGGFRTGAWAGLTSGAVMTVGLIVIQIANLDLLGARADYRRELAASGLADMPTYLASDAVAAATTHMVINVALGLAGGVLYALRRGIGR